MESTTHRAETVRALDTLDLDRFDSVCQEDVALAGSLCPPNTPAAQLGRKHRLFSDAVESMVEAIHAKDEYTRGHSKRVGSYAELIARALGLSEQEVEEMRLGGRLHDVGKIGIPDSVLGKDGRLAKEEMAQVREHPTIGEQILAPLLREHVTVLAIVRWHHERFDGHGFPDGLSGSVIPLGARIVAVADAFDAMTSKRPYRPALSMAHAVRELVDEAGRQFDPECVRAFVVALSGLLTRSDSAPHGWVSPEGPSRGQQGSRWGRQHSDNVLYISTVKL
jgi:HD-GYP domain-containing protein (c-di-GMP phosphodiesterase class II)